MNTILNREKRNTNLIGIRPALPISDPEIEKYLRSLNINKGLSFLRSPLSEEEFSSAYHSWITADDRFQIKGLEDFKSYSSLGTTQAFHDFYQIHHSKTLVIRHGEYPYHVDFFSQTERPWKRYKAGELTNENFVILSYPFSGNGSTQWDDNLLKECCDKKVDVLLDCAMWGLSYKNSIDLRSFPCIKMLAFSASKFFNIGNMRAGLTFSKYKKASLYILSNWKYTNRWGSFAVLELLKEFPPTYIYNKYSKLQKEICRKHQLKPSDVVFFGLGDSKWLFFQRDNKYNRVCLSLEYEKAIKGKEQ